MLLKDTKREPVDELQFLFPDWVAAALTNGDETGLNYAESEALEKLEALRLTLQRTSGATSTHWVFETVDPGFRTTNDLPGPIGTQGAETDYARLVFIY